MDKKCEYCGEKLKVEIKLVGNVGFYNWKHNHLHEDCLKEKNARETEKLLSDESDTCCHWLQLQWYIFNY